MAKTRFVLKINQFSFWSEQAEVEVVPHSSLVEIEVEVGVEVEDELRVEFGIIGLSYFFRWLGGWGGLVG